MAWTTPRTWVTSEVVTASLLNTHVRDNLKETSAATAVAAGDIVYADGANSMGGLTAIAAAPAVLTSDGSDPTWRRLKADSRTDSATSTTTVWNTLGGVNWFNDSDQVEVSVDSDTIAVIHMKAILSNATAGARTYMSFAVSGASSISGNLTRSLAYESGAANDLMLAGVTIYLSGLTAGTNVFTLVGHVTAGTGKIEQPAIIVQPY